MRVIFLPKFTESAHEHWLQLFLHLCHIIGDNAIKLILLQDKNCCRAWKRSNDETLALHLNEIRFFSFQWTSWFQQPEAGKSWNIPDSILLSMCLCSFYSITWNHKNYSLFRACKKDSQIRLDCRHSQSVMTTKTQDFLWFLMNGTKSKISCSS